MERQGSYLMTWILKLQFLAPAILSLVLQIVGYVTPGWWVVYWSGDIWLSESMWYYLNCTSGVGCETISFIGYPGKFCFPINKIYVCRSDDNSTVVCYKNIYT